MCAFEMMCWWGRKYVSGMTYLKGSKRAFMKIEEGHRCCCSSRLCHFSHADCVTPRGALLRIVVMGSSFSVKLSILSSDIAWTTSSGDSFRSNDWQSLNYFCCHTGLLEFCAQQLQLGVTNLWKSVSISGFLLLCILAPLRVHQTSVFLRF